MKNIKSIIIKTVAVLLAVLTVLSIANFVLTCCSKMMIMLHPQRMDLKIAKALTEVTEYAENVFDKLHEENPSIDHIYILDVTNIRVFYKDGKFEDIYIDKPDNSGQLYKSALSVSKYMYFPYGSLFPRVDKDKAVWDDPYNDYSVVCLRKPGIPDNPRPDNWEKGFYFRPARWSLSVYECSCWHGDAED